MEFVKVLHLHFMNSKNSFLKHYNLKIIVSLKDAYYFKFCLAKANFIKSFYL